MRKKLKIILSLVCVALLGLIFIVQNYKKENKDQEVKTDVIKFMEEYEGLNGKKNPNNGKLYPAISIDEKNMIKYSNADKISKLLDKGTGVIYLGYPECPWCRNAVPVLINALKDASIDKLYYMNMHDERDKYEVVDGELKQTEKGTEGYKKLLEKLDSILDDYVVTDADGKEYKTNEKRIYVPTVVFVKEGKIVGYHNDTVSSQKDPYVLLDEKQKEELYDIYSNKIHTMLDDLCDERC